ncbi:MAG: 4-hydroxy-tetrahydrodipicolinate reductase [Myxococcales bacterium]|nr:MAG: 4-hydroxy-tetrahydrodipicolinate reductase [Myxococcales bacterium]
MSKVSVAVVGAAGRMGRAVISLVLESELFSLVGALDSKHGDWIGRDAGELSGLSACGVLVSSEIPNFLDGADVVVDFSTPDSTEAILAACIERKIPVVVGTTGLSEQSMSLANQAAKQCAVIVAPNYSEGVTVLFYLAEIASRLLGEFDAEIVEMHHRHKIDAPSGTALGLAKAVARARELGPDSFVSERKGQLVLAAKRKLALWPYVAVVSWGITRCA